MMASAKESKPPSAAGRFVVGHDAGGRWVVCDRMGIVGGIFVDQATALRFARRESNDMPGAVCCVPDTEVLDFFAMLRPAPQAQSEIFRRAA